MPRHARVGHVRPLRACVNHTCRRWRRAPRSSGSSPPATCRRCPSKAALTDTPCSREASSHRAAAEVSFAASPRRAVADRWPSVQMRPVGPGGQSARYPLGGKGRCLDSNRRPSNWTGTSTHHRLTASAQKTSGSPQGQTATCRPANSPPNWTARCGSTTRQTVTTRDAFLDLQFAANHAGPLHAEAVECVTEDPMTQRASAPRWTCRPRRRRGPDSGLLPRLGPTFAFGSGSRRSASDFAAPQEMGPPTCWTTPSGVTRAACHPGSPALTPPLSSAVRSEQASGA